MLDIRMPPHNTDDGIQAAERIRIAHPEIGIVLLSAHLHPASALRLVDRHRTGGLGYLLKDHVASLDTMIDALVRVAAGQTVLDPDVVRALVTAGASQQRLDALSPRELDVLALMAEGRSNGAIGRRLQLSEKTIETHTGAIFTKLRLHPEEEDNRRVRAVLAFLGVED